MTGAPPLRDMLEATIEMFAALTNQGGVIASTYYDTFWHTNSVHIYGPTMADGRSRHHLTGGAMNKKLFHSQGR